MIIWGCKSPRLSRSVKTAAMLQQPRVPPTGQRQAIEIQIKWREVLAQKQAMLKILSQTTGHSPEKLDKVSLNAAFYIDVILIYKQLMCQR